jgi:hypothetical protein
MAFGKPQIVAGKSLIETLHRMKDFSYLERSEARWFASIPCVVTFMLVLRSPSKH